MAPAWLWREQQISDQWRDDENTMMITWNLRCSRRCLSCCPYFTLLCVHYALTLELLLFSFLPQESSSMSTFTVFFHAFVFIICEQLPLLPCLQPMSQALTAGISDAAAGCVFHAALQLGDKPLLCQTFNLTSAPWFSFRLKSPVSIRLAWWGRFIQGRDRGRDGGRERERKRDGGRKGGREG